MEFDNKPSFEHKTSSFSGVEVSSGASVSVKNVTFSLPPSNHTILHDVSFNLSPGGVLGIIGPNGAGKSTLLRLLYRYHKPTLGNVEISGRDIWEMTARETARQIASNKIRVSHSKVGPVLI